MKKKFLLLLSACIAACLTACMAPGYNVTVYVSPDFLKTMKIYPSMELDIVGINTIEQGRVKTLTVDQYFEYNSAIRGNMDHCTVAFSEDDLQPKQIKKNDPIWKTFAAKSADQLFLIANIPDNGSIDPANDARKLLIPLEAPGLFSSADRYFELSPSGILQLKNKPANAAKPVGVNETGKGKTK